MGSDRRQEEEEVAAKAAESNPWVESRPEAGSRAAFVGERRFCAVDTDCKQRI